MSDIKTYEKVIIIIDIARGLALIAAIYCWAIVVHNYGLVAGAP